MHLAISFGANLGTEEEIRERFERCYQSLCALLGEGRRSGLYRTAPVGPIADQPAFLNAVALWPVPDVLDVDALLGRMLELEREHGRERVVDQGPRHMDLDILFVGALTSAKVSLTLPHPRWRERAFVLRPLEELLGGDFKWNLDTPSLAELLAHPDVAAQEIEEI